MANFLQDSLRKKRGKNKKKKRKQSELQFYTWPRAFIRLLLGWGLHNLLERSVNLQNEGRSRKQLGSVPYKSPCSGPLSPKSALCLLGRVEKSGRKHLAPRLETH